MTATLTVDVHLQRRVIPTLPIDAQLERQHVLILSCWISHTAPKMGTGNLTEHTEQPSAPSRQPRADSCAHAKSQEESLGRVLGRVRVSVRRRRVDRRERWREETVALDSWRTHG